MFLFHFFVFCFAELQLDSGIVYNWDGQTKEERIFVETSDGKFYYVDFLEGKVIWSIETGGNVCTSTSSGQTTFVPSIDGYLFTYSLEYGFQRLAMSIRELVFTAPFRMSSGEIFSSGKRTTIFEIDERDGTILSVQSSNSTTPLINQNKENNENNDDFDEENHITIIRIDYDLSVYNGDSQLVRYS